MLRMVPLPHETGEDRTGTAAALSSPAGGGRGPPIGGEGGDADLASTATKKAGRWPGQSSGTLEIGERSGRRPDVEAAPLIADRLDVEIVGSQGVAQVVA